VKRDDGKKVRVSGTPQINTKAAAEAAERREIERVLREPADAPQKKEVPTFDEWFHGRFWTERLLSRQQSVGELENKRCIYKHHVGPFFGEMALDKIATPTIAAFRAALIQKELKAKTINNILAVVSTVMNYAVEAELIDRAPKIGLLRYERPEIEFWEFDEYAQLVEAAEAMGHMAAAAVLLAGEAGLRVGEVTGLRWCDVDFVGGSITVAQKIRRGEVGPPKGRRRRSIPMTATLSAALRALGTTRSGFVIADRHGLALSECEARELLRRVLRRAGLAKRSKLWHLLRHSYGTHAALLGVNGWLLMVWMGHRDLETTLQYTHVARAHQRPIPTAMLEAGARETDPDRRVLAMLSARRDVRGKTVAKDSVEIAKAG
jgi:integrase